MISLIDTSDEKVPGNLDELQNELSKAVQESATSTDEQTHEPEAPAKKVRTVEVNDEELPENLRGKTVADIVRMYQDSQSTIGRMANDLGQQRKLTDRLLDLKRGDDLQRNGAPAPKPVQVSGTELLDNPTEAIERVVAARLEAERAKAAEEAAAIQTQNAAETFMTRHADFQQVGADPEFAKFVTASPYRQRLAGAAHKGDWAAADELLTEFKDRRAARMTPEPKVEDKNKQNLEAAQQAALESGASSNTKVTGGNKKIWTRIELLELQMKRPHIYYDEATQEVILQAYREGRVK